MRTAAIRTSPVKMRRVFMGTRMVVAGLRLPQAGSTSTGAPLPVAEDGGDKDL
jgi:hypothetical protein